MAGAQAAVRTPAPTTPVGVATSPTRHAVDRLRREAATTPGRLRAGSLLVTALLALAGAATYAIVVSRTNGVRTVQSSEPLIVDAQALATSLSQADATAANAFLGGGLEPADERTVYQSDLSDAGRLLADAATRSGSGADVQGPLRTLAEQIPVYSGLVDTARANNRQGFPVGAAYLRQASRLTAGTIRDANQKLFAVYTARLAGGDHRARRGWDGVVVLALLGVVAVVLVGAQVRLFRQSNRLFNLPMVAATVLAVVVLVAVGTQLLSEASQATRARNRSYASINALAQVRTAAFRAKGDESLTLIGRGNGTAFDDDFNAQAATLTPLLDHARAVSVSATEQSAIEAATTDLQGYLSVHKHIRDLDNGGQFNQAVTLAVGGGTASASNQAFGALDNQVTAALNASQADFVTHADAARHRLAGLTAAVVVMVLAAAALSLYGFQQRINEYR